MEIALWVRIEKYNGRGLSSCLCCRDGGLNDVLMANMNAIKAAYGRASASWESIFRHRIASRDKMKAVLHPTTTEDLQFLRLKCLGQAVYGKHVYAGLLGAITTAVPLNMVLFRTLARVDNVT